MKLFTSAVALACLAVSSVRADGATAGEGEKSWGYKENDPSMYGPSEWGTHYPTCAGTRQSPIDISDKTSCGNAADASQHPLAFAGECSSYKLTQSEDAYKGASENGTCTVRANSGSAYSMLQFHMHAPAEHTLNGKVYDGEVHFVHQRDNASALLVVGLFFEKKANARTDPWLTSVWDALGNVTTASPVAAKLGSYASLLTGAASKGRVYNYPGSLTTPVCSEIVDWWVIQKPLQVSAADFDKFQTYLAKLPATDKGRGARPTQALSGRTITVY
ncbi:Carbonic anhydrase [Globisporangium polare]